MLNKFREIAKDTLIGAWTLLVCLSFISAIFVVIVGLVKYAPIWLVVIAFLIAAYIMGESSSYV